MFSKSTLAACALTLATLASCAPKDATITMPAGIKFSPQQQAEFDALASQYDQLQQERAVLKERLYVQRDEAMRLQFEDDWETYQGHLHRQLSTTDQLKEIDASLATLKAKIKALENKAHTTTHKKTKT